MRTETRNMSVSGQKVLRSSEVTGAGVWEFEPGITPVKNNSRKVNLKRAKHSTSGKISAASSSREIRLKESANPEKKKHRNANESDRCPTARSHSTSPVRGSRAGKPQTVSRTRSMSPTPSHPRLNAEWPLRKFYAYMSKIIEQFEIVKIFISHEPEEGDSLQEINRQRKRATEFAVRFSRNNVYQMKRLVSDIKQIIVPYMFDNLAKSDSEILCKKILLAYQSATQSLQTYINYLKNGQNLDVPEKARELIVLILDLYLCCEHISLPNDQIDLLGACKELIVLLDKKIGEEKRKSPLPRQGEKIRETQEEKRFSMYRTKLTNSSWKKKTEALAKIKFGMPKLSYLKRMKKKEEIMSVPRSTFEIYSQRLHDDCHKKASWTEIDEGGMKQEPPEREHKKTRATPGEVTSQDDDIETVVQSIDNDDSWASNNDEGRTRDDPNVRDLMQTIHNMQGLDVENSLKNLLKSLTCQSSAQPRNVKLIHVISPDPIPEEPEEECREEKEAKLEQPQRSKLFKPISGDQSRRMRVSEETCSIAVTYKKMLTEYRRSNIMYMKGMPVRPCELVPRISDEIINEVLLEISSGMENENLLTQLYYNELLETI